MIVQFHIHYQTIYGQQIYVCGSAGVLGNWDIDNALPLKYTDNGNWFGTAELAAGDKVSEYKYLLKDDQGHSAWEWGENRRIPDIDSNTAAVFLHECWHAPAKEEKVLSTSAFRDVIIRPDAGVKAGAFGTGKSLRFSISVPRAGGKHRICVLGNQAELGGWDRDKPLLLTYDGKTSRWSGTVDLAGLSSPVKYKYGLYDSEKKEIIALEEGADRHLDIPQIKEKAFLYVRSDEGFRYPTGSWKGAGVSVPVFSLRSEKSFGVGEFSDLTDFIDWAKSAGLKMVQLLPVNETIASHNWFDSYPYKAISVTALHPIYMNLEKMGALDDKEKMKAFKAEKKALNQKEYVDYPEVLRLKSEYYKLLFDQEKGTFFDREDYKLFFENNREWLVPYAAFAYLRDRMKTPDFRCWGEYSNYDRQAIEKISRRDSPEWDDIAVHFFIQFHLDRQLGEAAAHARKSGIVLKGDIPIGVSPDSVETWMEPRLFNLDGQAGAPPDDFAVKGQNWGFPTYNWDAMAAEGYRWWKKRLRKMADYFDAYRIDHILGFFRIWEIPKDAVEGLLGHFNPALPLTADEIGRFGIRFDFVRMAKPYIRHHLLQPLFGEFTDEVIAAFLEAAGPGEYRMKDKYDTQAKVNRHFLKEVEEEDFTPKDRRIRGGLFDLIANVLFIQTGQDQWHPRISMHSTSSFGELDEDIRNRMDQLYIHYFYKRHNDFWYRKGMEKLPVIMTASNMLVCGEDLGMVPDCVHPVMDQLNILSLEIQRMSKKPEKRFAHPDDAPYLSVCTTSTHDMSTMRGWWEEDRDAVQLFYEQELGHHGPAPVYAEPEICRQIIAQHVYSPAMWTTFPIQDLIAMDENLRWSKPREERINYPDDVRHRWRFRMRQSIDDLKKAGDFNLLLKTLITESGRSSDY